MSIPWPTICNPCVASDTGQSATFVSTPPCRRLLSSPRATTLSRLGLSSRRRTRACTLTQSRPLVVCLWRLPHHPGPARRPSLQTRYRSESTLSDHTYTGSPPVRRPYRQHLTGAWVQPQGRPPGMCLWHTIHRSERSCRLPPHDRIPFRSTVHATAAASVPRSTTNISGDMHPLVCNCQIGP